MQISLRSQLVAGTAAIVGASAIALTPVTQPALQVPNLTVPTVADVALAAFNDPIAEVTGTLDLLTTNLFKTTPTLSPDGWLPQVINDPLPLVRQLGVNASDYVYQSLRTVNSIVTTLGNAAWTLPANLVNAAGLLLQGNVTGAINALVAATITPVVNSVTTAAKTLGYIAQTSTSRAFGVLNLLPTLLPLVVNTVIVGQVQYFVNTAVSAVSSVVTNLANLNFEGAWNAAIAGALGPTGIPGAVVKLITAKQFVSGITPSLRGAINLAGTLLKPVIGAPGPVPAPFAAVAAPAPLASASVVRELASKPAASSAAGAEADDAASADHNGGGNKSDDGASQAAAPKASAKAGKHGLGGSKRAAAKAASSAE